MRQIPLREFLIRIRGGETPANIVHCGYPEKVIWRKVEKYERRGYLEYGVSWRYAWLTNKGQALLDWKLDEWRAENEVRQPDGP